MKTLISSSPVILLVAVSLLDLQGQGHVLTQRVHREEASLQSRTKASMRCAVV